MNGTCLCGRVTLRVARAPDHMNACNCSLCTKLGALWGYYTGDEVTAEGETRAYTREDVERPALAAHGCPTCGTTTHYVAIDGRDRIGVNMRLFEPDALAGIEVRYGDRRYHPGTEPRREYRARTVFGADGIPA